MSAEQRAKIISALIAMEGRRGPRFDGEYHEVVARNLADLVATQTAIAMAIVDLAEELAEIVAERGATP